MTHKILYGPHEYRIDNDERLDAVLDRINHAVDGGGSRWVEIPDAANTRILITPGIPIAVVKVRKAKDRPVVVLR